ncbi:MAG: hypothetical protein AB7G28_01215 [Pirellulales bacterium]
MAKRPTISLIRDILSRYNEMSCDFPERYDDDVRQIVNAFHTASTGVQKKMIEYLRRAYWIPGRNAHNGHLTLFFPDDNLYLPNRRLQLLFQGEPRIWFVDRTRRSLRGKKSQAVLEACGVAPYLQRAEGYCEQMLEKRKEMRVEARLPRFRRSEWKDYEVPHLERLLKRISQAESGWQDRSLLLWECLHEALDHHGADFFHGKYRWWYGRKSRSVSFPAVFLRQLRAYAWLPGVEDVPQRPSQIGIAELPRGFRRIANSVLVQLLEIKTDNRAHQQCSEPAVIRKSRKETRRSRRV